MDNSLQVAEAEILLYEYTQLEAHWSDATAALKAHILHLLHHNLPALYQLLYRVDIDERKARQAFGKDAEEIAEALTALILQRVLEKAASRLKYRNR